MDKTAWLALLSRIPPARHDSLMVTMTTGTEIMVQNLARLDAEYMIIRGRLAGSTDDGRVMILPYDQICNLGFSKRMTEAEIHEIFGNGQAGAIARPTAAAEETPRDQPAPGSDSLADPPTPPEETGSSTDNPPSDDAAAPAVPSKSLLLARLRARLAEKSKGPS